MVSATSLYRPFDWKIKGNWCWKCDQLIGCRSGHSKLLVNFGFKGVGGRTGRLGRQKISHIKLIVVQWQKEVVLFQKLSNILLKFVLFTKTASMSLKLPVVKKCLV